MNAFVPVLLLVLPMFALAAPAEGGHCVPVFVNDDGTHGVSQSGFDVTVNGAGVVVDCFGFRAGVDETISTMGFCRPTQVSDDGVHGVSESGGTVTVNGVGADGSCTGVFFIVPETFYLP